MNSPLRILHLEDAEADSELVHAAIENDGLACAITSVRNRPDFVAALGHEGAFDLILADFHLPQFTGMEALKLAKKQCPHVPFIFVSGTIGEERAVEVLKSGATDYVMKDRLAKIGLVMRRALEEAEEQLRRRRAEEELRAFNENLEARVAERTRALEEANRMLEEEARERRRAELAAEKASRAKSEFMAGMSHELRTPLNAIIGFSQLLSDSNFGALNERQAKYVNNIQTSGRHLLQLINDILDLAKVESGRLVLRYSEIDVVTAIRETHTVVQSLAMKKNIRVAIDDGPSATRVTADEAKFKQIMYNLLSNAIKFTRTGGRVAISARAVEERLDVSAGSAPTPCIRVDVSDTGIGIKPRDQERVFGEFTQVDSSYAREQEGTGLGLTLVRKLVALHGGRVWVESEGIEGRGSVFSFVLPLKPIRKAAAEKPESSLVLVVDDDPQMLRLLEAAIQKAGYRALTAPDGREALTQAMTHGPSAIILDLLMPGLDGFAVLEELESLESTRNIPVLIFTGKQLDDGDILRLAKTTRTIVSKPDVKELLRHLSLLLPRESGAA